MQGQLVISFSTGAAGRAELSRSGGRAFEQFFVGRSVAEVQDMVPLIFNLCRMAQKAALELALGLSPTVSASQLREERLKEGLARLGVLWPLALGRKPRDLPGSGATVSDLSYWLYGGQAGLPDPDGLDDWIGSEEGVAPLARDIRALFAEGEGVAVSANLCDKSALEDKPFENSVAWRNSRHSLMRAIEHRYGRGPLWRFFGLLVDMQAIGEGQAPSCRVDAGTGLVLVDAPRGTYALRAQAHKGRVTAFERRTPTDHMAASGGSLERGLASLKTITERKVAVLVALCDPCLPVSLREVVDA